MVELSSKVTIISLRLLRVIREVSLVSFIERVWTRYYNVLHVLPSSQMLGTLSE